MTGWARMLCVLLLAAVSLPSPALVPNEADYVLSRGMVTLGQAHFQLSPGQRPDCWVYEYQAKPTGLARLFIGQITERSEFCIENDQLRPQRFRFTRADKEKENFSLEFDWAKGIVRSSLGELRPVTPGMTDRLSLQIAVQRWVMARGGEPGPEEFTVTMVEDDRVKTYRFRITARETVETPAGRFETARVERVDDRKKSTRFWLAPARGYQAVRVEQIKDGSEQLKMLLK